jgi:NADPH:quinone reductase-like Zn-dependent oxidoreductase
MLILESRIHTLLKYFMGAAVTFHAICAWSADTMRQYQMVKKDAGYTLELATVPVPAIDDKQILVKIHAASLNRRDIFVLSGSYPAGDASGHVPLSDGAGEVIAVGKGVKGFKVGDRVAGTFFTQWQDGKFSPAALASARGGAENGMLAEMTVATADSLVKIPVHLSYEEASTLPCAGVTAWNALFKAAHLQKGEYVLLEGTGGVSIFGLQFAAAAGARPIITSSSDAKLARARELGAIGLINYKTKPDWDKEVMALTNNAGVDHVLEVGGQDTIGKAGASLAFGGHIALIGGLSGFGGNIPSLGLMGRGASVSGIYVGSKADFEAMNAFISQHKIKPVIDKVFPFADAPAAFKYMEDSEFVGKIVIKVGE